MASGENRVAAASRTPRPADVRAARPYFLAPRPVRALARRAASVTALVAIDVAGLVFALYGALVLREIYYGKTPLWGLLWEPVTAWLPFLALITVLVFARAHLYAERERRPGLGRVISSLLLVTVVSVGFVMATGHDFNTYAFAPTAALLAVVAIGTLRASYEAVTGEILARAGTRRRAVFVGEGEHVDRLRRALGSDRNGIAYEFLGVVSRAGGDGALPVLGDLDALARILDTRRVDELIVTDSDFDERVLLDLVDQAQRRGVKVRLAPKTTELLPHPAEFVPGHGVPLFELGAPVFGGTDWAVKRTFDVTVSVLVLLLRLPLCLVLATAIRLESSGSVLYRSRRVGLGEREFEMLKFRTMVSDAEERQAELEARNEATGPLFKIRSDPRVTRVGAVLRRFSLDEIPNVLNVLRGEMSLVGPRPLPLRDYEQLEDWHRKRYHVLPGMTGLWQISGRSTLSFDDLVRLDFYYLENWSLWLDITILAKTLPAVLVARGAY